MNEIICKNAVDFGIPIAWVDKEIECRIDLFLQALRCMFDDRCRWTRCDRGRVRCIVFKMRELYSDCLVVCGYVSMLFDVVDFSIFYMYKCWHAGCEHAFLAGPIDISFKISEYPVDILVVCCKCSYRFLVLRIFDGSFHPFKVILCFLVTHVLPHSRRRKWKIHMEIL